MPKLVVVDGGEGLFEIDGRDPQVELPFGCLLVKDRECIEVVFSAVVVAEASLVRCLLPVK